MELFNNENKVGTYDLGDGNILTIKYLFDNQLYNYTIVSKDSDGIVFTNVDEDSLALKDIASFVDDLKSTLNK